MDKPVKSGREEIDLSVVVIGRNEEKILLELFRSLPEVPKVEWLYVDSQSDDLSVQVALEQGAKVLRLERESVYAPGTGRHVGTLEAKGRWILYLDGDMVLRKEFSKFLESLPEREKEIPPQVSAFTGRTRNIYLDEEGAVAGVKDYAVLGPAECGPAEQWGCPAAYHGGAVLYRREAVLAAGNWNPAVLQLEEIDLLSRIRAGGGELRALDLPMADHYTPRLEFAERVKMNFLPRYGEKRLYGAGQVVKAALSDRRLLEFMRYYPYPFAVFGGLVMAPPLFLIWPPLPLLLNLGIATWIGLVKRPYYYLVYLGNLFQIFRGFGRYRPFTPRYSEIGPPGENEPPICPEGV